MFYTVLESLVKSFNDLIKSIAGLWNKLAKKVGTRTLEVVFIVLTIIVSMEVVWLTTLITIWFLWQMIKL